MTKTEGLLFLTLQKDDDDLSEANNAKRKKTTTNRTAGPRVFKLGLFDVMEYSRLTPT